MRKRQFLGALLLLWGCGPTTPPLAPESAESKKAEPPDIAPPALRLASGVWAPFTDGSGKPRFAMDLVHDALKRAGVHFETKIVHPQELMPALKDGTFEGSEALWLTEERSQYLLYSEPYLENRLVLLARKGTDVSAKSVAELRGKKLGVVKDYAYGAEILETSGPELVLGESDEGNLRALLQSKVDYIVVDALLVYFLFEYSKEKASEKLVAAETPLTSRSLYFAVRKDRKGAADIIARFNQQLPKMKKDGSYHRYLKVSWIVADVDGDGQREYVPSGDEVGALAPESQYHLTSGDLPTGPRFLVDGEVYDGWNQVPAKYKVPGTDPVDRFQPGVNAVLFEF